MKLVRQYGLSGYSINCYPALKSKICLAVARMNDNLCASGCESDLNSTFMMYLLQTLSGKPAFNGDFLRMYHRENAVLFSHCGAGAFSLAKENADVQLSASIETCDGCAVCYATHAEGALFERAWGLRGMEDFLADMLIEPKFVYELMERITNHHLRLLEVILPHDFDAVYFGDDWGSQNGLIMGAELWRKMIKPYMKKLCQKVKDSGFKEA